MVEEIYKLKNMLIESVMNEAKNRGPDHIDHDKIDMIKDLAEAEKSCWEASYYRQAVEGVTKSQGYMSSGYMHTENYDSQSGMARQGYGSARQGYDSMSREKLSGGADIIEKLGEEYRSLTPDDRMTMRNKVLTVLGAM